MSFFDKVRRQKLLSFTLILFTLAIGVVIGTLVNTGVKAAKDEHGGARRDAAGHSQRRHSCRTSSPTSPRTWNRRW